MVTAMLGGVLLGLGLIVPIGQQNVFVLSQGVALGMPRALVSVVAAACCDTFLILLGAGGASVLLDQLPWLRPVLLALGVLFLFHVGIRAMRTAVSSDDLHATTLTRPRQVIGRTVAVSLLNPHAILDTVGVLGTAITAQPAGTRLFFGIGVVTASWVWFLALASAAAMLRKVLTPARRVVFDRLSGVIMLGFAVLLAYEVFTTP
jgi:L-lysine exporter family protein LysE/ArgO